MPTARRRTGGIAGTENPSADSHDPVVAELRTMVAALKTRIAILEESERKHRETTHQLGLDVVTLGQTLNSHIRAWNSEPRGVPAQRPGQDDADRFAPAPVSAKSSRRGKTRARRLGSIAGPALGVAGLLILLAIILFVLPRGQRNRNIAPPPKAANHSAAMVVLGDSSNVTVQEPAGRQGVPAQSPDQAGHVLYAPPATTP
jgi:hypothetical protein